MANGIPGPATVKVGPSKSQQRWGALQGLAQTLASVYVERKKYNAEQQRKSYIFKLLQGSGDGGGDNSEKSKLDNMVLSTSYDPFSDEYKAIYKSPTPETAVQRATRIKTERDLKPPVLSFG